MDNKRDAREEIKNSPEESSKSKKDHSQSIKNKLIDLENYLSKGYDFRYNEITSRVEFKKKTDNVYLVMNERAFANLKMESKIEAGINTSSENFKDMIESNRLSKRYNPLKDFLFSLPVWDEQTDWIAEYLKQVQLIDQAKQQDHFVKSFKKWFVNLVGSLVNDKVYNENCFILVGGQGIGKTRFFMSLIPEELRMQYYYIGTFTPHNKDHEEMLGTKIIINLDELSTLNRTDIESLKSRMSQAQINLRRAYGRLPVDLNRIASFCGSINKYEFLSDQTGSRRFLPFGVEYISNDSPVAIENLYSQALVLFKKGFNIWFSQQEIRELEEYNLEYKVFSIEEDQILNHYKIPDKDEVEGGSFRYSTTTDIANSLSEKYPRINVNQTYINKLGAALYSLGFQRKTKRIDGHPLKVWVIKERFSTSIQEMNKENEIQGNVI